MKYIGILIFCFLSVKANCQIKVTCNDLKNGIYYAYMKNSPDQYMFIRENGLQREINMKNGDTALYKIEWGDDCSYTLKLLSTSINYDSESKKFLKKHKMLFEVYSITDDYYVYNGYVDKNSNPIFITDTIWLREKQNFLFSQLFKQVTDSAEIAHFTDTSKYALLYIYRPGKLTNSLGNYLLFFDGQAFCVAKNNSGYIFKIFKEGNFSITSRLFKDESSINLNIKYGKSYFAKSMIHWGIYSNLNNFKLEMAEMDKEQGLLEFEKVKHK